MTLLLKPRGRGNWNTVTMTVKGKGVLPIYFYVGVSVVLGGVDYRICAVWQ
jgi:hypothetical protein